MTDMNELAAKVESADGPDRVLDYLIFAATLPPNYAYLWDPADSNHRYTASLDAAMTLVPEGWAWMVGCAAGVRFCATIMPTDESGIEADAIDMFAATPALALCAAALRSRALASSVERGG